MDRTDGRSLLFLHRMNPSTLGWYLPLLVKDIPGALQPSDDGAPHGDRRGLSRSGPSSAPSVGVPGRGTAGGVSSSSTVAANQRARIEFNVSARRDGAAVNARPARGGKHGGSTAASDDDGDVRLASGDALASSTPPRARGAPPTNQPPLRAPKSVGVGVGGVGLTWKDLDAKFRRDLPDDVYAGRMVYRGLVMRACPRIRTLDGLDVSEKEKEKAERLLESVLDRRRPPPGQHPQRQ